MVSFSVLRKEQRGGGGAEGNQGLQPIPVHHLLMEKNHVMSPVKKLGFFISNLKDIMKRVKHE